MFNNSYDAFKEFTKLNGIQFIDLKYTDLPGYLYHLTLPIEDVDERLFDEGVGFDSSSVIGLKSVEKGDMILVPDLASAFFDPFYTLPTLSFFCYIKEADTKAVASRCPRGIALRVEKHIAKSGLGTALLLPELEFNLFDEASFAVEPNRAHFYFQTDEVQGSGFSGAHTSDYHKAPPLDIHYNLRSQIVANLQEVGIPVRYHHHEVGKFAQEEIELELCPLLKAADAIVLAKYIIRMTASQAGVSASFLPKAIYGDAGNGLHLHQLLTKDGESVFYGDGYAKLSATALNYIGGLLNNSPALVAFTNPSTNSFKRLIPNFEAPTCLFFGLANRAAAVRIPKYCDNKVEKRIEFRSPDATMNPHIAISAMLLAGLKGIEDKVDPSAKFMGPFDEDVFKWDDKRKAKLKSLPKSLESALVELEKEHGFLTKDGIFTESLIHEWIEIKREEIKGVSRYPNPYEIDIYYEL